MQRLLAIIFILFSQVLFAQNIKLRVSQNGEIIKLNKGSNNLVKEPFALVFKFKNPFNLKLIAGSETSMTNLVKASKSEISRVVANADFGGADSYFNTDKSIKAWGSKVYTGINFEDETHHAFDSLYKKGNWFYGVRTIKELATPNDYLLVEDWKVPFIIIGIAAADSNLKFTKAIKLNLETINYPIIDVRGKEFLEVGVAEFQEGCEGCGNLGSFHFLANGKEVDYLLSGSDIFSFGKYTQVGSQVSIPEEISFTISEDGETLTENKYGTEYKLDKKR